MTMGLTESVTERETKSEVKLTTVEEFSPFVSSIVKQAVDLPLPLREAMIMHSVRLMIHHAAMLIAFTEYVGYRGG